ncbi:MAG: Ig-like domain-containing protein, partial [Hyphomicrobium sp.]
MITISASAAPEILFAGMIIGRLSSGLAGTVTYDLTAQDPPGLFTIVGDTVVVTNSVTLDAALQAMATLSITATNAALDTEVNDVEILFRDLQAEPGTAGDDEITFASANTFIDAGGGHDNININPADGTGTAVILGGDGNDFVVYIIGTRLPGELDNPDYVSGGAGNDYLFVGGDNVNTTIDAGTGRDEVALRVGIASLGIDADSDVVNIYAFSDAVIHQFNAATDKIRIDYLLQEIENQYGMYTAIGGWDGVSNPFAADVPGGAPSGYIQLVQDGSDTLFQVWRETPDGIGGYTYAFATVARLTGVTALDLTADNFIAVVDPSGTAPVGLTLNGTEVDDVLNGGLNDDTISGGNGADRISGSYGDDTLTGGAGYNDISGGAGNDVLSGGNEGNRLIGNGDDDTIWGGDGIDYIESGTGSDTVNAGASGDTISDTSFSSDVDYIDAGDGDDIITYELTAGPPGEISATDTLMGGAGNDTISALSATDLIVNAGSGNDGVFVRGGTVTLGSGFDTIEIYATSSLVVTDFNPTQDRMTISPVLFRIGDPLHYQGITPWTDTTNPFAVPAGTPFLRLHQNGAHTELQILHEEPDAGNPGQYNYSHVTIATLQNVNSSALTHANFVPAINPDGSNNTPNSAPVAVDDSAAAMGDGGILIDVLANDGDLDSGDTPATFVLTGIDSVVVAGSPGIMFGMPVVAIVDNKLGFAPGLAMDELPDGDTATVTITYTMRDAHGATSSANLVVTFTGSTIT